MTQYRTRQLLLLLLLLVQLVASGSGR